MFFFFSWPVLTMCCYCKLNKLFSVSMHGPDHQNPLCLQTHSLQDMRQQAAIAAKVFIQRDYTNGTVCQFQTKFPSELETRVGCPSSTCSQWSLWPTSRRWCRPGLKYKVCLGVTEGLPSSHLTYGGGLWMWACDGLSLGPPLMSRWPVQGGPAFAQCRPGQAPARPVTPCRV